MDNLDFSEEEIQEQLAALGYKNIPKHRLREFKRDLDELVRHGEWKSLASSAPINAGKSQTATSRPSPPAYTKEKVSPCYFEGSGEGFFLHAGKHDRQALATCQNGDYEQQQGRCDSYARHSVALNLQLPPGAPSRLQVEEDPDDTLRPPLSDSYTSTPESHRGRFIKRKVLRKHKGQSLVCDESVYSEDSERREEEEEVKVGRVIGEVKSKPLGDAEDSHQKTSEEEELEIERAIGKEESKPVGDAEDSHQKASQEEVKIGEEDSTPISDSEDSYQEASEDEDEIREGDSTPVSDAEDSYQESSEEEEEINKEDSKPVDDAEESYQETLEGEEEVKIGEEDSQPFDDAEDSYTEASEEEARIGEEDSTPVSDAEDSYQESSEEEEGEIVEEDSKPVDDAEESYQEASEDEEEVKIGEEDSQPVDDTEDSYQESSEEEEEEGEIIEEDSKPVDDAEESYQEDEKEAKIGEEDSTSVGGSEEESKPVGDAGDSYQEAPDEETRELNNQVNINRESLEVGRNDNDNEESRSSSSDSPAPSLMTSGYGTYRPEEHDGGDYRDDHTITEFDQDSRGDLSEVRDDEEDDHSMSSFGGFYAEPTESECINARPLSALAAAEPEADVARCRDFDLHEKVDVTHMKPEEDNDQADEEEFEDDLHGASNDKVTNATSEEQRYCNTVVQDGFDGNHLDGENEDGVAPYERLEEEEEAQDLKDVEDKVESEDPDESSSNKDIKFIDSKVDFSQMTFNKMCVEFEGNLRQKKDATSFLEERLADLRLSTSAQRDFETENEDVTSQSDAQSSETEGVSLSAFESYMRGMTRTQSEGDLRPKPKSFIRPVMSQQTIKKTDPVAKYFQYKQLWEMFKLPGEKDRRDLRWEIKERLAYQPPPPKPRRVYVPNTYIVPTEKKRSALRWEIRNDLANGVLPHKFSYRF